MTLGFLFLRLTSLRESRHGLAEISERSLRLEEALKSRAALIKGLDAAKRDESGKRVKHFDYEKLCQCFDREVAQQKRNLEKIKNKNGVTSRL